MAFPASRLSGLLAAACFAPNSQTQLSSYQLATAAFSVDNWWRVDQRIVNFFSLLLSPIIRAPVQCLGFCLASIARLLPPVGIVRPEWRADRRLPKASRALQQQQQQQFGSSAAAATGGGELCESSSSAPTVEPLPFHRPQWDRDRRPRRREVIARNLLLVKCSLLLLSVQSWLEPAGKGPEPVVGEEEEEEGNVLRCSCCTPDHHLLASLLCCWTTPRHQLNPTRLKHQIISANLPTRLKHPHQAKPVGATSRRHRSHLGEQ